MLEDWCGFEDSVTNHRSVPIPEDIPQVNATAHLLKIFIRILSVLCRQRCMRSASIPPILADGRTAGKDNTKLDFEGT